MGVVCYVHMLIVVFLSIHTVPYIYVHSLIVVSLIAFFLSIHLVYMLTCRLSFSYLYISYIIFSLVDCRVPIDAPVCIAHSLIVVSHDASRMYMLKRWLYYIFNFFSNTHRLILISGHVCTPNESTCNDKTDRRCIVVSMLCKWYRDRRARWYQDLSNLDIAHK